MWFVTLKKLSTSENNALRRNFRWLLFWCTDPSCLPQIRSFISSGINVSLLEEMYLHYVHIQNFMQSQIRQHQTKPFYLLQAEGKSLKNTTKSQEISALVSLGLVDLWTGGLLGVLGKKTAKTKVEACFGFNNGANESQLHLSCKLLSVIFQILSGLPKSRKLGSKRTQNLSKAHRIWGLEDSFVVNKPIGLNAWIKK